MDKSPTTRDASPEDSKSDQVVPLHRRRFDAKHKVLPDELNALPNASSSKTTPDNPRSFCEDLVERLQKKNESLEELKPLFTRTTQMAVATISTEDAFDHLDKLYKLVDQLLILKDQNSKIQRRVRDLEHIKKLQEVHLQIEREMIKTKSADTDAFFKNEATSMDMGEEYEYTEALLDSMLAAGRNASLKRAKWKSPSRSKLRQSVIRNQRSRSMGGEELESCPLPEIDYSGSLLMPYKSRSSLRRASDMSKNGEKSKISKWTRVKAAFKWEKAHTGISEDMPTTKSSVSLITAPSPSLAAMPASESSASSTEDVSEMVTCHHEGTRRSRSLDSAVVLDPISCQLNQQEEELSSPSVKLHKTPWGKMKNIIQTRKESVKKKQNRNSIRISSDGRTSEHYLSDGGGLSQSESLEIFSLEEGKIPRRKISNQEKNEAVVQELSDSAKRNTPTLTLTLPSSEELTNGVSVQAEHRLLTQSHSNPITRTVHESHDPRVLQSHALRKQKSLDIVKKQMNSLTALDSSDPDTSSPITQRSDSKWKKVKKAFLTSAPTSTPSSPSRTSAFFSYESDDMIPGKNENDDEDQIKKDYKALQNRLDKEFSEKFSSWNSHTAILGHSRKMDSWDKVKPPIVSGKQIRSSDSLSPSEEKTSDFKKKVYDWQKPKGTHPSNFACVPSQSQLSEDFRKKLEEWKRLKATNSVPTYTGDDSDRISKEHIRDEKSSKAKKTPLPPNKEVLVQTGAGFFRFEGISRSFTRKLYEWEKSRGIAPECSTSALLRESLARPPLPTPRVMVNGPWPSTYQISDRVGMRLQRSQSAGSVRDDSVPHISTSASSLSLTHIDDCNNNHHHESDMGEDCFDTGSRDNGRLGTESDSDGGPGAVLVEVEDEVEETAAPLVACSPCADPQTPVYRYGQAQERHRACENTERKLSPITQAISVPLHSCVQKVSRLKLAIGQLVQQEQNVQKLLMGRKNVRDRCDDVSKKIGELKGQSLKNTSGLGDMERRIIRLNKEEEILANSLNDKIKAFNASFEKFNKNVEEFRALYYESVGYLSDKVKELYKKVENLNALIIERYNAIDTTSSSNNIINDGLNNITSSLDEINKDMNKKDSLCVSYIISKPKINSKNEVMLIKESEVKNENDKSKAIIKNISSSDDLSDGSSKGAKKKIKSLNERSGSCVIKRKSKSRQRLEMEKSMHSDSDSENEVNTVTVDIPRRKKPLRTRYPSESQVNYVRQNSNTDSGDNVFVLKLRSNSQSNAMGMEKHHKCAVALKKIPVDNFLEYNSDEHSKVDDPLEILIPEQLSFSLPTETIEVEAADLSNTRPDVFVKTTRKIFSPIRRDSSGETKAVIGFDLEEIANSIKSQNKDDNLPDIVMSKEIKMKLTTQQRNHPIFGSESLNNISHSPSPLSLRKQAHSNSLPKFVPVSRNESEESLNHYVNRRGSGDRLPPIPRGSPILSRSGTPCGPNSLPPLPASPPSSRKPSKETAPSIRIMIQKYNMRLNEEGSETKSQNGSNTPPWRSPRSQERFAHENRRLLQQSVRNNPFINREVKKSASASQIMRESHQNSNDNKFLPLNSKDIITMTPPLPKKLLRGILKSSSAGSLKSTLPSSQINDFLLNNEVKDETLQSNDTILIDEPKLDASNIECSISIENDKNIDEDSSESQRNSTIYGKKIDLDLLRIVKSSTCIPIQSYDSDTQYVSSESSRRAMKLKKAKELFLASGSNMDKNNGNGIRKDRNTSSNIDLVENRLSQISFSSDVSYDADSTSTVTGNSTGNHDNNMLIKSASVGMINVERNAFDSFNKQNQKKNKSDKDNKVGSRFGLSSLASKFRKVRMRSKSKQPEKTEEKEKLDTVTKLCRQSLLVNLRTENSINKDRDQDVKNMNEVLKCSTDHSIVLAGKTGGAVAVNNEEAFAPLNRTFLRSSSAVNSPGCSKRA